MSQSATINYTRAEFNRLMESVGCPVRANDDEDCVTTKLFDAFIWLAQRVNKLEGV